MNGQFPTGQNGWAVYVKRVLTLVGVALVLFLIITNPGGASSSVQNIGNILYDAAQSVSTFFTNLV
ncbi:hypothetical protein EV378_2319 [Pseudonocardia endophytica]|jgi:hypothetical protein|uniref:Uncharacterized protein n=1 Tax=Pseudonocardia endophytica TaxID=401976 RepID=A0A4R1I8J4_PSEEN|nr:hypothetical protein EV378_2319 [Pseudonocardia endophytica]